MINHALFTSQKQGWLTPSDLMEELQLEFNFDCDPCLLETDTIHNVDMLGSDWGGKEYLLIHHTTS